MLTRICLFVAIIAGLAVGALNFIIVKDKVVTLQTTLQNTKDTLTQTQGELNTTKTTLAKTETDLKKTKQQLTDANTERDAAVAKADDADKRAQKAADDLATTQKTLTDTKDELARYTTSGLTPEQAFAASKTIKDLTASLNGTREENRMLGLKIRKQEAELNIYRNPDYHVPLPAELQGQVVVSDPKWDFVVINVGEDQGVIENGELLVSRHGKLIAKVIVRSVQKGRCIANVMPGWKNDEVMEGDSVIPAYPAQS